MYIVQLLGGASCLATVPDPADPSKHAVSAQVEPRKAYRWEHAQTLSGPWTQELALARGNGSNSGVGARGGIRVRPTSSPLKGKRPGQI